jgi:ribosomal protein S18 acetylase RimI-like enzyme
MMRNAVAGDARRCHEIEQAAFAGPEAAPLARIAARIAHYPEGFRVCERAGRLIGFINSGCADVVDMSDDAFKALVGHDPAAPNVVILSVAVDPAFQGQGVARAMMTDFVARMRALGKREIHLICKTHHIAFYERLGYRYNRLSTSAHGGGTWHEMALAL